jgi:hypothetical protein
MTSPAGPPPPPPPPPPDGTGIADIERTLRQILQAVGDGQDNRVGPLVEQLGKIIQSVDPANATGHEQAIGQVRTLWKQTALALASARHQAGAELHRIAAGRSSLRAYRT